MMNTFKNRYLTTKNSALPSNHNMNAPRLKCFRHLIHFAALSFAICFGITTTAYADPLTLRHNAVVDSAALKLSDLFYGLPQNKDKVIGNAPRPGEDMRLNARTLLRIALATHINWRPTDSEESIVIERAATIIENEDIKSKLKVAMTQSGIKGAYDLSITEGPNKIILSPNHDAVFEIKDMQLNQRYKKFSATLFSPNAKNPIRTVQISGNYEKIIDIPVLNQSARTGFIIGTNDIDYVQIKERDLRHDTVLNENTLIGKTPRRIIVAGEPIKKASLKTPKIVSRGDMVTMVFENGPLQLTTQAKALQNGAKGDLIRVVNLGSSKTLQAIVSGDKEVTVQTF